MMPSGFRVLCLVLATTLTLTAGAQPAAPPWTTLDTGNAEVEEHFRQLRGKAPAEAFASLKKLADAGDGDAVFALARAHAAGIGVASSDEEANRLLQHGAELGHAESVLAQGAIAEEAGDDDALFLYSQAAELGSALAMLRLGRCNENAEFGLGANPGLAARFYSRAHEAGNARATFELARCYQYGVGLSPDALNSTKLYRQAADAGVAAAQLAMAEAYAEGRGVVEDNVAAVGWLLLSAQNGNRDALVHLGDRYETGSGVVQDLNQAGQYFSNAAKRGDQVARYRLAMLYIEGRGTKPDLVRGYVLLAEVQGLPPAQEALQQLQAKLTPEQLAAARRRLAEGRNKNPAD